MSNPQTDLHGLGAVPLFPLPNVVLFPKAVQPLHIFEERYKAMTGDALRGDGARGGSAATRRVAPLAA